MKITAGMKKGFFKGIPLACLMSASFPALASTAVWVHAQMKNTKSFVRSFLMLLVIVVGFPAAVLAAPKIMYLDSLYGPKTGGEGNNGMYLSIFGKGFGSDINAVTVTVGGGTVARKIFLGPSLGRTDVQQLSVQLGPAVSTGPVKVTVGGVTAASADTFTVISGNIYFISLSGSSDSNPCTFASPCRTANAVVRSISVAFNPGDSLVVMGGTWFLDDGTQNLVSNRWIRIMDSGTANAPKTVMMYPDHSVHLQENTSGVALVGDYSLTSTPHTDYWQIAGLSLFMNDCAGAYLLDIGDVASAQQCAAPHANADIGYRIVNGEMFGNGTGGLCGGGSGDANWVYDNCDNCKFLGVSVHDTSPLLAATESSHEIYLASSQTGTEVGWCSFRHIPATRAVIQAHMDSFGGACDGPFITGINIHDNEMFDLAGQPIIVGGETGDVNVYNNLIYQITDVRYDPAIALRGGHTVSIYNNTVYGVGNASTGGYLLGLGFTVGSNGGGIPIHVNNYNNIYYVTNPAGAYYGIENDSTANLQAWIDAGGLTSDNNIWYGSSSPMPTGTGFGTHEIGLDPQFVNPSAGNFHQQSNTSPGVKAGSTSVSSIVSWDFDLNPRSISSGYDIGAYQFVSGVSVPATPPAAPRGFTLK